MTTSNDLLTNDPAIGNQERSHRHLAGKSTISGLLLCGITLTISIILLTLSVHIGSSNQPGVIVVLVNGEPTDVAVNQFLEFRYSNPYTIWALGQFCILYPLLFFSPLILAILASRHVTERVKAEPLQTQLSPAPWQSGILRKIKSEINEYGFWFAIFAGWTPSLILAATYTDAVVLANLLSEGQAYPPVATVMALRVLISWIVGIVSQLGNSILGIVGGISLGTAVKRSSVAQLIAGSLMLLVLGISFGVHQYLRIIANVIRLDEPRVPHVIDMPLGLFILYMLAPYVLSALIVVPFMSKTK